MTLRVVVASAVVSRKVGRGRHRLGAFFLPGGRLASVRRLLVLVSAIIFVDALLFTALTPLVPTYADEFDLSKTGAGLLVGAYGAGRVFGGIPGGLASARFGPKRAVVVSLLLLAVASFAFAPADSALALGVARFVQGIASTATWAGRLTWISVEAPRERRGEVIGTAFGVAIFGAILGPVFGGVADVIGIGLSFALVGVVTLAFAGLASLARSAPRDDLVGRPRRALRDSGSSAGSGSACFRRSSSACSSSSRRSRSTTLAGATIAIAAVFFSAGLVEVVLNPLLGRFTDRAGRLMPIRAALAASVRRHRPRASHGRRCGTRLRSSISFGSLYTPGMSLTSHRAERAGSPRVSRSG